MTTEGAPALTAVDDLRDQCGFCAELERRREHNLLADLLGDQDLDAFVLYETPNFAVIPAIGALCDGYVLVTPKAHVLSFGYLDPSLADELADLLQRVERWLVAGFGGAVTAFEHGAESFRNRGGSCTDHAHMHVLAGPADLDLMPGLTTDFTFRPVVNLLRDLGEQVTTRRAPYLWVRSADGGMHVCDAPKGLSQHVRRVLAVELGRPGEWDWLVFPGVDHMRAVMRRSRERPL